MRFPAPGIAGGWSGAPGELLLDGRPIAPEPRDLLPGSELVLRLPGGGGFGDPRMRDPQRIAEDLEAGYVTSRTVQRPV
ncbi:MAG: hypothetical protein ACT4P5_09900 [Armatimonadota bacterium]